MHALGMPVETIFCARPDDRDIQNRDTRHELPRGKRPTGLTAGALQSLGSCVGASGTPEGPWPQGGPQATEEPQVFKTSKNS